MSTISFPYDNPSNYTYDSDEIEISSGAARLKLQQDDLDFTEHFTSDSGFTYDNTKVEFSGGKCQQKSVVITEAYSRGAVTQTTTQPKTEAYSRGAKTQASQRPTNATFGATFTSSINGSWGNGTLTGTATGGATIASGKLDLAHADTRYVTYSATSNANSQQVGCVRFVYTPNYSGNPTTQQVLFDIFKVTENDINSIQIHHRTNGDLWVRTCDQNGNYITNGGSGAFNPTSGADYEIEFNYDFTTGSSKLFVNGVQNGPTHAGMGTRSTYINYLIIGTSHDASYTSNFKVDNFEVFSTVQHTSDYTAGYTVPEADYLADVSAYTTFNYTYLIDSIGVPTIVDTNTPHYVVNGQYWNGSAWAASSDTYATSMTSAQWIANYASFPSGSLGTSLIVKAVFQDTNTAASVTSIDLTLNEYNYIESLSTYSTFTYAYNIVSLGAPTITDANNAKYIVNGYAYYGGSWQASSNTYATAMSKTDWVTNYASFPGAQLGTALIVKTVFPEQIVIGSVTSVALTINETHYATTNVTLPEMEHTLAGTIKLFNSFTTTESGTPRYTLQIGRSGNYLYWNGSAWVISSGTYTQANDKTTFNANCGSLPVDAENYGQFKIHFTDSNSQSYVDELTANMNVDIGYLTTNPKLVCNTSFIASELSNFVETITKPVNTEAKYTFTINGIEKYINAGVLTTSNGTYAQANTAAEIVASIAVILTARATTKLNLFLHTSDDQITPELDTNTLTVNTALPDPSLATLVELEGFIYNPNGPASGVAIEVRPFQKGRINQGVFERYLYITIATTDSDGWFSGYVYRQPTDTYWEIRIGSQSYVTELPAEAIVDLSTLTLTYYPPE